jgi:hypothetical protein
MEPLQGRNDPEYIAYLELRIAELERRLPRTDLLSGKFLRRAFAVWGHMIVAQLMVAAPIYALIALAAVGGALFNR